MLKPSLKINRGVNYWATIALFIPLFVQRIFIGGVGGEYSDYAGFSTWWIGYTVHFGLIASILVARKLNVKFSLLFGGFVFVLLSAIQIYYVSNIEIFRQFQIILPFFRSLIWLLAVLVYSQLYFNKYSFMNAFLELTTISAFIILGCYLSYFVTGIPFGIDIGRGVARPQGLFSEPSALAAVFPAYTVLNFYLRRYWIATLGLLTIILVASATVYISFLVLILFYLIINNPRVTNTLMYSYVSLAVISTLFIQSAFIGWINDQAGVLETSLNRQFGPSVFREVTIDRVISAANGLNNFINQNSIADLSSSGSGARLAGSIALVRNMNSDGTYWTGYGIGVYGYISNILYQSILDFGLLPFLISSFGVFVGTIAIYWVANSVVRARPGDPYIYIILLGGLIGTLYNSAGGIHAYTIAVLAVFIPISRINSPKT
jgi:hypothetical protein